MREGGENRQIAAAIEIQRIWRGYRIRSDAHKHFRTLHYLVPASPVDRSSKIFFHRTEAF